MTTRRCIVALGLAFAATLCVGQNNLAKAQTNQLTGLARCTTPIAREGKAYERFLELNQRARAAGTNAEIIFVGDSITQGWGGNGKEIWAKYYTSRHALNLGIGSDHTQHVLW